MTHRTYEPPDVPAWPVYALTVYEDGRVDATGPLVPSATHPHRTAAVGAVAGAAVRLGRPVRADATEADGTVWHLVVAPDGSVGAFAGGQGSAPRKRSARPTAPVAAVRTAAEAAAESGTFADSLALVTEHLEAGRIPRAAELAAQLDERVSDTIGVSHVDALRIREVRGRIHALLGDPAGGVRLFRDVAERWHYQKEREKAEDAAARAETLWLQITDVEAALATGIGVVRMRNQIPGEGGAALTAVLEHQAWLESARAVAGRPGAPHVGGTGAPPAPAADPGAGAERAVTSDAAPADAPEPAPGAAPVRAARPERSWDRPARDARTAAG